MNLSNKIKGLLTPEQSKILPVSFYPEKVGKYPAKTKAGGGFRYDRVLEYRVWFRSEKEAANFASFTDYFEAAGYAIGIYMTKNPYYVHIVALIEQDYYYECKSAEEPEVIGEKIEQKRITEWNPEWILS